MGIPLIVWAFDLSLAITADAFSRLIHCTGTPARLQYIITTVKITSRLLDIVVAILLLASCHTVL
jgi:hypothetical protein